MPDLAPIHPRYLRDQAFVSLREAIVSGALPPGSPLVIDTLADTFGLSTMPVREAVKRLVERRARRGAAAPRAPHLAAHEAHRAGRARESWRC